MRCSDEQKIKSDVDARSVARIWLTVAICIGAVMILMDVLLLYIKGAVPEECGAVGHSILLSTVVLLLCVARTIPKSRVGICLVSVLGTVGAITGILCIARKKLFFATDFILLPIILYFMLLICFIFALCGKREKIAIQPLFIIGIGVLFSFIVPANGAMRMLLGLYMNMDSEIDPIAVCIRAIDMVLALDMGICLLLAAQKRFSMEVDRTPFFRKRNRAAIVISALLFCVLIVLCFATHKRTVRTEVYRNSYDLLGSADGMIGFMKYAMLRGDVRIPVKQVDDSFRYIKSESSGRRALSRGAFRSEPFQSPDDFLRRGLLISLKSIAVWVLITVTLLLCCKVIKRRRGTECSSLPCVFCMLGCLLAAPLLGTVTVQLFRFHDAALSFGIMFLAVVGVYGVCRRRSH